MARSRSALVVLLSAVASLSGACALRDEHPLPDGASRTGADGGAEGGHDRDAGPVERDAPIVDDFVETFDEGPLDGEFLPPPPPADAGPLVTQANPPPPISGGTLIVAHDHHTAIAADPDRDLVWVVDTTSNTVASVGLMPGDEPGRVVEDAAGRAHVALRRGGAVVTIDVAGLRVVDRTPVCSAPRGLAYDPATDRVHVACAGGELVTLAAAGGAPVRVVRLDDDLRDVLVNGDGLLVSRFRSAQVLHVDASGAVTSRETPAPEVARGMRGPGDAGGVFREAETAWRMVAVPGGTGAVLLHQRAFSGVVSTSSGGYTSSECPGRGIVGTSLTPVGGAAAPGTGLGLTRATLAVDEAISPDGSHVAVIAAGNARVTPGPELLLVASGDVQPSGSTCSSSAVYRTTSGESTAVAYDGAGGLIVQNREPAALDVFDEAGALRTTIVLGGESREDTGHVLFHGNAGGSIACASCHPEGGDDGRVWTFDVEGPRRTQALRGGLLGTEPFHWDGDMPDFGVLAGRVFTERMGGGFLAPELATALGHWLDAQRNPPAPPPADPAAVDRGRALFADPSVACTTCHAGPALTNNATMNVGTGGMFQVPSLRGVRWRAPYLHDGCAPTLRDRFGPCGGGDMHGHTSALAPAQVDDLVAYLQTL